MTSNEVELPREDELEAAIERADERYLIEWVAEHPTTIEQARAGIARFFDRIGEL